MTQGRADTQPWRLVDTGVRSASENIALERAMLAAHSQGRIPHTLRFLRFTPCALVGYHQGIEQELRLDYCRAQGIEVQRRVTGGGAIYFDEGQLGWELYLDRSALGVRDMDGIARRICEAAARAIGALGVDARFRPRNDIEVDGRKISGTGGVFEGDSFLYQGTLLVRFDIERMLRVLRIPTEKLTDKAIASACQRVVSLEDLLGHAPPMVRAQRALAEGFAEALDVTFEPGELTEWERRTAERELAQVRSNEWVHKVAPPLADAPLLEGVHRCSGGLLRAWVALDRRRGVIKQAWIQGDLFVDPPRAVVDLEAALKDTYVRDLQARIAGFFDAHRPRALMVGPEDFLAVIRNALARAEAGALHGAGR